MNKTTPLLIAGLAVLVSAQAGDLDPPTPPAPTMVTLQEIYDKAASCNGGGFCGVFATGQTTCSDALGGQAGCAGTGQDGELQRGASTSPRFTDNGNGTVTDNLTRLTWLKDAGCFGARYWTDALSDGNQLASGSCGLADGSVPGDWRLPNVNELRSILDYGQERPALPADHPFVGVESQSYWTSSTYRPSSTLAWAVGFATGESLGYDKDGFAGPRVWPVRGAP